MIRWNVIGQITHWSVTVLTVIWLFLLTDWIIWIDLGEKALWRGLEDVNQFIHRTY